MSQRDEDATGAFGFQGTDKTLNDGNGTVFSYGPESGLDFPVSAPALESLAPELTTFVRDDVFGRLTGIMNSAAKERTDWKAVGSALRLKNNDLSDDRDTGSLRFLLR